jgi:hypothetical protein
LGKGARPLEPHRYLYQPVPLLSFAAEFAVIRALGLTPLPDEPSLAGGLPHLNNVRPVFGRCWTGSNEYAGYRTWGSAEY